MKKVRYAHIANWLLEAEILTEVNMPDGKKVKRPTKHGKELGITVEERMGQRGPYEVVVYNRVAQQFILDNLDAVIEKMK